MDLGCLDMGCIEKQISQSSHDSDQSPNRSNSKSGKNKSMRESAQSSMGVLNKLTTQIKKPPRRKTSPLNWFPRMKVDSYLKRKIKLLQEVGGMNSTLDETLGDSNPHYSKVLREKIAVREAAHKAMEARKAALVEASWCRILKAAMIESKEAEALLLEAEKSAAEAFEAANAIGVIMFDIPDCPGKHYEIETSAASGDEFTTHTIRASFETAFDVDKQVAAAVKAAFVKLASCSSVNKDEFKELLRKISQNPDRDENSAELSEFSSECESDAGSDVESGPPMDLTKSKQITCKKMPVSEKFNTPKLLDMMLQRLRCLQEEELASLATIVATCGLNAALAESETTTSISSNGHGPRRLSSFGEIRTRSGNTDGQTRRKQVEAEVPSLDKFLVKHMTRLEREVQEAKKARKKEEDDLVKHDAEKDASVKSTAPTETTGLGSVLVKRGSKFEKDIEEAKKNSGKMFEKAQKIPNNDVPDLGTLLTTKHTSKLEKDIEETKRKCGKTYESGVKKEMEAVPDLGSLLTTKHTSKLEKEIEETKKKHGKSFELKSKKSERAHHLSVGHKNQEAIDIPSLDQILVKHVSKLEKEVEAAKNRKNIGLTESGKVISSTTQSENNSLGKDRDHNEKENINMNNQMDREGGDKEKVVNPTLHLLNSTDCSGDSLIPSGESISEATGELSLQDEKSEMNETETSLDKILVKPIHKLERAKLESLSSGSDDIIVKRKTKYGEAGATENYESLDKVLVKHVSKLEKEKLAVHTKEEVVKKINRRDINSQMDHSEGSLDQILIKHKSRLEREKVVAVHTKEEVVKKINRRDINSQMDHSEGSLDQILIKHKSRLEREKVAAASEQPNDQTNKHNVLARKEARQRNLQLEQSEGSLDQIMVKHKSRLEKEKVAAAAEQQNEQMKNPMAARKEARERELQEAWGGLSFGNSMQPRLSRLQLDKAAWLKAEEEERMRATEEV